MSRQSPQYPNVERRHLPRRPRTTTPSDAAGERPDEDNEAMQTTPQEHEERRRARVDGKNGNNLHRGRTMKDPVQRPGGAHGKVRWPGVGRSVPLLPSKATAVRGGAPQEHGETAKSKTRKKGGLLVPYSGHHIRLVNKNPWRRRTSRRKR